MNKVFTFVNGFSQNLYRLFDLHRPLRILSRSMKVVCFLMLNLKMAFFLGLARNVSGRFGFY